MKALTRALVTGARGFVGRHLCAALSREDVELSTFERQSSRAELHAALSRADIVFHLAGVNRPHDVDEYARINHGLTVELCAGLEALGRAPRLVLASSVQAELDNPYGASKRAAEEAVLAYTRRTGGAGVVYRFSNLFGKWCRPDYNSVTATFCHRIARDLPIDISDPDRQIELTHIDAVVEAWRAELCAPTCGFQLAPALPSQSVSLQALAELIRSFHDERTTARLPRLDQRFVRALHATYMSYLEPQRCAHALDVKADARGSLAEILKGPELGQLFVSRTRPGITRGNHYHHTKVEKFLVLHGEALVRLRRVGDNEVFEHRVRGEEYRMVDIPPGYTHSIQNVGAGELVTLFWASEMFDPRQPDTFAEPVLRSIEGTEAVAR